MPHRAGLFARAVASRKTQCCVCAPAPTEIAHEQLIGPLDPAGRPPRGPEGKRTPSERPGGVIRLRSGRRRRSPACSRLFDFERVARRVDVALLAAPVFAISAPSPARSGSVTSASSTAASQRACPRPVARWDRSAPRPTSANTALRRHHARLQRPCRRGPRRPRVEEGENAAVAGGVEMVSKASHGRPRKARGRRAARRRCAGS